MGIMKTLMNFENQCNKIMLIRHCCCNGNYDKQIMMGCGITMTESFRCGVSCLSTTVTDVCIIINYHKLFMIVDDYTHNFYQFYDHIDILVMYVHNLKHFLAC